MIQIVEKLYHMLQNSGFTSFNFAEDRIYYFFVILYLLIIYGKCDLIPLLTINLLKQKIALGHRQHVCWFTG